NVIIGPYAVVGDNVKIGSGCRIDSFAHVLGYTRIGENNHIFPYAVIGNIPQDLKYKGEISYLIIGNNNRIREFATINPGTDKDSKTVIGNNNLFMAYSHIAHDCQVKDSNIFANSATLAGYVSVGNNVVIGGLVAIHQFCRIGDHSIIGGCSKVVQDIPPYSMCDGHPAIVCGLNLIGLKRANFSRETISGLKKASKILFFENLPFTKAKALVQSQVLPSKEIENLLSFVSSSKRGIAK
ncbi:MAG: acyl-ACP--UDP-N-acetylglucosamine O-acyltransferase, partial [Candidatus Omnitrophica bacterium]|nr:acyl-ACP--UDP-N-acetylglucosamine O-acyltransferase [Candidatus Omnitrophota bacterium]